MVHQPPDRDLRLTALAAALADGAAIDWAAAEASAETDAERERIRRLRSVRAVTSTIDAETTFGQGASAFAEPPPAAWGPLRVIEKIGQGRFGDVYRAWDSRLDREVALKLLRRREARGDDLGSQVVEEGRLLAKVRHPNVVTVHGADRIDDRAGIWMELVRGRTLADEVAASGPFPPDAVVRIGLDVCRALAAVHAAGLVHRDVKAQNVMRDEDGRLVLMDFGTGRECESDEPTELAGTPLYLAPEVLAGHKATPQADLYSLGVMLFHLATGGYPVAGRSLAEIKRSHRAGPPDLRAALSALPRPLAAAMQRALTFDPSVRFQHAAAMEAALDPALPRPPAWRRGRAAAAVATALAAVALVAWTALGQGATPSVPSAVSRVPLAEGAGRAWTVSTGDLDLADVSDDGRFGVGVRRRSGLHAVVLRDLDTGHETEIRETRSRDTLEPMLSADARFVAFRVIPERGSGSVLMMADVRSGHARALTPAEPRRGIRPRAWTPDGRAILAEVREPQNEREQERTVALAWISTADGTQETIKVFDPARPPQGVQLSPDGSAIAYSRLADGSGSDRHIFVMDGRSRTETGVVRLAGTNSHPVWTPDGRHLIFVSDRTGGRALWSIPVRAGRAAGEASVLMPGFLGRPLRVATTGTFFSLVEPDASRHVEVVADRRPDGGRVVQAFQGQGGQWSPDGASIAFYRLRADGSDLVIRDYHTADERSFPGTGFTDKPPRWLPDGSGLLVFVRDNPRNAEPPGGSFHYLGTGLDRVTRRIARHTPRRHRSIVGCIAPDSRGLFLAARAHDSFLWTDIVRVDLRTGAESHVITLPGEGFADLAEKNLGLAINPDGKTLAIMAYADRTRQRSRIMTVGVDGTNYRAITDAFPAWGTGDLMDWTPDGASIVFVSTNADGDWRVMRVGRNGGPIVPDGLDSSTLSGAVPLPRLVRGQPWTIDLSPNGSRILFGMPIQQPTELWAMDGILAMLARR